ncbi:MAG: DUF295 domain-containing protein [Elusimicrobiota bacterium]
MAETARPFQLEPAESLPEANPSIADDDAKHYWLLSNGRSWKLSLGQNIGKVPPEIFAARSGVLFVGLYHGSAASISPEDGRIIDRAKLIRGNMVYWGDYDDLIVAVGEVEIGVFDLDGKLLWRAALGDVIDEIKLDQGVFQLTDVSGETGRYEARTGRIVSSD